MKRSFQKLLSEKKEIQRVEGWRKKKNKVGKKLKGQKQKRRK